MARVKLRWIMRCPGLKSSYQGNGLLANFFLMMTQISVNLKSVISLLSINKFSADYTSSSLAPMLSNFLVNHARSKKGKLSVSSKGFFLKSDLKENLKKTSPNDY